MEKRGQCDDSQVVDITFLWYIIVAGCRLRSQDLLTQLFEDEPSLEAPPS